MSTTIERPPATTIGISEHDSTQGGNGQGSHGVNRSSGIQYAQSNSSAVDAGQAGNPNDVTLLARLTYAAGANQPPDAQLAVGYSVRTQVEVDPRFPSSYGEVINQPQQHAEVGGARWVEAGNPAGLQGRAAAAYQSALNASTAAYYGTAPNPTNGAEWFHSFRLQNPPSGWFHDAPVSGAIHPAEPPRIDKIWFFTK